jgi:hypothetical protein
LPEFRLRIQAGRKQIVWKHQLGGAAAVLCSALALSACGGGGDSTDGSTGGNGNGGGGNGAAAGRLLYAELGKGVWYDLGHGSTKVATSFSADSLGRLGFGGGLVTEVEDIPASGGTDEQFVVHLHSASSDALPETGTLPVISASGLRVSGPVQPSADGSLFAVHTREFGGLDNPVTTDNVYVIDRQGAVKLHAVGDVDPVWLSPTTLAVASGDGLFKLTIGSTSVQRIGPAGLGAAGQDAERLSVSPDGQSIAFTQAGLLWRIGVDGNGLTQLTASVQDLQWSAWSPDGTRIAVQLGECAVLGAGGDDSHITVASSTTARQDLGSPAVLMTQDQVPAQSCGPLYWRP